MEEKMDETSAPSKDSAGNEVGEITRFLQEWAAGNKGALDQMMPKVLNELRRTAHLQYARMKGRGADRPTELVGFVWERLNKMESPPSISDSKKFYAYCARIIQNLLLDRLRSEQTQKRSVNIVSLDDIVEFSFLKDTGSISPEERIMALDLLSRLEFEMNDAYEVFVCKKILGFKDLETAEILGIAVSTVQLRFTLAKSWLYRELNMR